MIDSHALVDSAANIADDVHVGAFSIIEADVQIGAGTRIGPHVVIRGGTRIGEQNKIYQFCSIGEAPQYSGYKGEPTTLTIGDRNIIREYCTLNRGTPVGGGITTIGDDNFIMAYVHVAHDCLIGNNTIFANGASLAGHISVGDHAILGGFTLVHQFCRIGAHCITGVGTVCLKDIPPYVVVAGNSARPHGINTKGLRRRHFSDETIRTLKHCYRVMCRSNLDLENAIKHLQPYAEKNQDAKNFVEFFKRSQRGVVR